MIRNAKTFIPFVAIAITWLSSMSVAQERVSIGAVEMPAAKIVRLLKGYKSVLGAGKVSCNNQYLITKYRVL